MRQHTIPLPLQGTSKQALLKNNMLCKLSLASCVLVLASGQTLCFGQTAGDNSTAPAATAQPSTPDVAKELDAMKKRIEQLEAELNKEKQAKEAKTAKEDTPTPAVAATAPAATTQTGAATTPAPALTATAVTTSAPPSATTAAVANSNAVLKPLAPNFWKRWTRDGKQQPDPVTTASLSAPPAGAFDVKAVSTDPGSIVGNPQTPAAAAPGAAQPEPAAPPAVDLQTPFAFADFTWMMAVPRNHDSVFDGKYFSGEFRWDTNYIYDLWHPIDHTLAGTTEGTRTGEIVLQALNVGGDFHWDHMQGRILLQIGADATAVPRNDASPNIGQWDLSNAYRYISEGYAGYHVDVQHGLNFQAGIFMSFIGLFSYYSFDNWTYQPSYVSSNTPWFFNGFRVQWFPTNKLKFEPWLINGWQSYGKFNGKPGLGGQILWRPTGNLDFVWNTYGLGQDTLYTHRTRIHEDDSFEWKQYENPNKLMHRTAMTFTFDIGCETGGGGAPIVAGTTQLPKVDCTSNHTTGKYAGNPVFAQNFIGAMAYERLWFDRDKFAFSFGGGWISNPGGYLVLLPPVNGATAISGSPYFTKFGNPGQNFAAYDFQASVDWMPSQFVTWQAGFTQRGANVPYFVGPGGITPPGGNQGAPGSLVYNSDGSLWQPDLRKSERRFIFALMVHL
jgi:Putative beta-barrel porin-2, OmpL-like. bbp2